MLYNIGAFGIPKSAYLKGQPQLIYSQHAINAAINDEQGNFVDSLPKTLNTENASLMEVEVLNGVAVKWLYRIKLFSHFDLVLVVVRSKKWFDRLYVKTIWINMNRYPHIIKNKSMYAVPEDP